MALGDLAKQLAEQALRKDVLDALRPPDLSRISETAQAVKPASVQGQNAGATILAQVQAMQKAVKEDEELVVLFHGGVEMIRVLEFFVPSWQVAVLTGIDTDKNITRVISPFESLQLICKVMKVQPSAKPTRVNFITPKPKPE